MTYAALAGALEITASIATMLQKTSDYANQVYHSLADHDLARYV